MDGYGCHFGGIALRVVFQRDECIESNLRGAQTNETRKNNAVKNRGAKDKTSDKP